MGRAHQLGGVSPALEPVDFPLDHEGIGTLIAFLSSGCLTCYEFWDALDDEPASQLPEGIRAVVVTKGPDEESVAKIRELSPKAVPVVMSSQAWKAYDVPGAPYFAWVDARSRTVQGVGAATQWPSVLRLLEDALAEGSSGRQRQGVEDGDEAELVAAGIYPGDPSLNDPVAIKDGGLP